MTGDLAAEKTSLRKLGEVRSLIPTSVHVMALTATATATTQAQIIGTLCMDKPHVLSVSPQKKNIVYVVKKKRSMEVVENLARGLRNLRTEMPRTIVFCKRYDECSRMYCLFKYYLRDLFTEPPGAPNSPSLGWWTCTQNIQKGMWKRQLLNLFATPVESFASSLALLHLEWGSTALMSGRSFCGVHRPTSSHLFSKWDREAGVGFFRVHSHTTQMLTIDGHQSKWWNTAVILTYVEGKPFFKILTASVIYNGHVNPVCVVMCACRFVRMSHVVVIISTLRKFSFVYKHSLLFYMMVITAACLIQSTIS